MNREEMLLKEHPDLSVSDVLREVRSLLLHKQNVGGFLELIAADLHRRALVHDDSKFDVNELLYFVVVNSKYPMSNVTYGTPEYDAARALLGEGLQFYYRKNRHHPEFFDIEAGLTNVPNLYHMSLMDITEMLCDWAAAVARHKDGDLVTSILKNRERFKYDDNLARILLNTALDLEIIDIFQHERGMATLSGCHNSANAHKESTMGWDNPNSPQPDSTPTKEAAAAEQQQPEQCTNCCCRPAEAAQAEPTTPST